MSARGAERPFHVVLLAGGSGTRFWPLSRQDRPKQFQPLAGPRSLLEQTWRRVRKLAPVQRIWVVAPARLAASIAEALPRLRQENLILEPSPRDTAPAIALAMATIAADHPSAVAGIFPTDHVIAREEAFARSVRAAAKAAAAGSLVCLGIRPDRPATGFGYLKCARRPGCGRAIAVERFVEKPDLPRARRFLRSGNYLWNGGMFVWGVDRFLDELRRTAPRVLSAVLGHLAGRRGAWARATRLSVDYAVMEQAQEVRVVLLDAGWDDVGSWEAAARLRGGTGATDRGTILVDSEGTVVFGEKRLIAVVDLPNVVVVDTPDALLVVSRGGSERVRQVVDELAARNRRDLL